MLIKLNSAICGQNFAHAVNDVIEWPDDEAKRMIDKGLASAAGDRRGAETAERNDQRRAEKR